MNNSLLEADKLAESLPPSNVNDVSGLRRQMKEQQNRLEACIFSRFSIVQKMTFFLKKRTKWIKCGRK
jgi:hypothetical protein